MSTISHCLQMIMESALKKQQVADFTGQRGDEFDVPWVPIYHKSKRISHLPSNIQLTPEIIGTIDYMKLKHIPAMWGLFAAAAQRGDNVGMDEFTTREQMEDLMYCSEAFSVINRMNGDLVGAIVITPWMQRSNAPRNARLTIVLSSDLTNTDAFSKLAAIAEKFAVDLDIGYEAVFFLVFEACTDRLRSLQDLGYYTAVTVPSSGYHLDRGLTTSKLLYKTLTGIIGREFSFEDIVQLTNGLSPSVPETYPSLAMLPLPYTFLSGQQVVLRNMEASDASYVYQVYRQTAEKSIGYSFEEFPTFQYYKQAHLMCSYTVILEDKLTSTAIGILQISSNVFSRSASNLIGELDLMLDPNVKGRGLGHELLLLGSCLVRELGYKCVFTDIFKENGPVVTVMTKAKFNFVGVLPKNANMKVQGWTDSVFVSRPSEDTPRLVDVIEESKLRMDI